MLQPIRRQPSPPTPQPSCQMPGLLCLMLPRRLLCRAGTGTTSSLLRSDTRLCLWSNLHDCPRAWDTPLTTQHWRDYVDQ